MVWTTTVSSIWFLKFSSYISMGGIFAYLWIRDEAFYILTILIFIDVLPVTLAFLLKWLDMHSTGFLAWSFSILSLYETYSILGNIYTIRTWKENNAEYDAVSELIKLLQNWINHYTILIMDKLKINSEKDVKKDWLK